MKTLKNDEIYDHLSEFLKKRGVEMREGTFTKGLRQSCHLLTEAINVTQKTVGRARQQLDVRLKRMRESIHAKTGPGTGTGRPPVMTRGATAKTAGSGSARSRGRSRRPTKAAAARRPVSGRTKAKVTAKPKARRPARPKAKRAK